MRIVQPYKQLNKLIVNETFEPDVSWGLRMAIAAMAPLIWGVYTGRLVEAGWVALMAECICWVELKGDFQHRLKLLAGSSALAILFALLGSITGHILWLSVIMMAAVAFVSSLLKNIGNRGSGLAICVYALFIFCNAYPTSTIPELQERAMLVVGGALWNGVAAVVASVFVPAQRPYRRSIAIIWKSISALTQTIAKGWDGSGPRSNEHDIYLKEKDIRTAIDASLELFETMAHESTEKDGDEHVLAQVRKAAAIVGIQVTTISEEMHNLHRSMLDSSICVKIFSLLRAMEQTLERMAVYTITHEPAEELILRSRISRLNKLTTLLKERIPDAGSENGPHIARIILLAERNTKVIDAAFKHLQSIVQEKSMIRSYSMMKTIFILHPKYWLRYIQILFNFGTFTARYALRSAIAAAIAMFIYKFWNIDHGYWIPFTLIIVTQTYFGATLKKARDRVIGTVAGGIVAGLFLRLPTGLYLQEALLFLTFIPMIVFLRKRYSWAAFFITVNLVLLFNINRELSSDLILTRALSTVAGSLIAVVAGFALLPTWDKKWLPVHLSHAIHMNYVYFCAIFFPGKQEGVWTKYKRNAESANSNAFDSFNRYMEEPAFRKRPFAIFYYIITHNIRITRELNNIQLEQGDANDDTDQDLVLRQQKLLTDCDTLFVKNVSLLKSIDPSSTYNLLTDGSMSQPHILLSNHQEIYLEKMLVELKAMNNDLEILA
ncbi:MAG: FUSC family protein, partial [Chitinophagaceae bacterium]|nr:FUSC family protein [Chitinophagaceae bacterium]